MRQLWLRFLMLTMLTTSSLRADCDGPCKSCSHSFLRARPTSQDMSFFMDQFGYYEIYLKDRNRKKNRIFTIEGSFIYQHSARSTHLTEYFLKNCSECALTIAQSPAGGPDPAVDINGAWIELEAKGGTTPFSSTISLHPGRRLLGGLFKLNLDLDRWFNRVSLCMMVPIVTVRHRTGLEESSIVSAGAFDGITNARAAFNNPAWNYGKIVEYSQSKTGIDDIQFQLYWRFVERSRCALSIYGNLFVPTSHGSCAHTLFEPTIGNGGHVGLGGGMQLDCILYDGASGDDMLTFLLNGRYTYFFEHKEIRSFDLCANGDWSRYLLVVQQYALTIPLPGINYLTRTVAVTPRNNLEFLAAFHYDHKQWNFELGYDYWYQQKERLRLDPRCAFASFGIYDLPHILNGQAGSFTTASTAPINQAYNATSDTSPIYVNDNNFNLASGTQPQASSCKLYGSVAYDFDAGSYPMLFGAGSSFEWGHHKTALSQWGVTIKSAISF